MPDFNRDIAAAMPASRPLPAGRLLAAIAGWWRDRQAVADLAEADPAMLRDLGLTRSQLPGAVRYGRH